MFLRGARLGGNKLPNEIVIPKEELYEYYSVKNMLLKEISEIYNCTQACLSIKVKKYGLKRNYQDEEWLKYKHFVEKKKIYQMAEESFSSEDSIRRWMKKYGIATDHKLRYQNMARYSFEENFFENIDTEEKAYWLGFIVADGCIYVGQQTTQSLTGQKYFNHRLQILLSRKDESHLEKFKKHINYTGIIEQGQTSLGRNVHLNSKIRITSKKLCEDLMDKNVLPRKSCNEVFPGFLNPELLKHFVRGYFDGDGNINFYKVKNKDYHSANITFVGGEKFLEGILAFVNTYIAETNANVLSAKETKNHTLAFGGRYLTQKIMDYLYKDATIFLDRKKDYYELWQKTSEEDIVRPSLKDGELSRNDLVATLL